MINVLTYDIVLLLLLLFLVHGLKNKCIYSIYTKTYKNLVCTLFFMCIYCSIFFYHKVEEKIMQCKYSTFCTSFCMFSTYLCSMYACIILLCTVRFIYEREQKELNVNEYFLLQLYIFLVFRCLLKNYNEKYNFFLLS